MTMDDAKWLRCQEVFYFWRFKPWEEPSWETVTIIGHTAKRVVVIHDGKTKHVNPDNLYEEKPT